MNFIMIHLFDSVYEVRDAAAYSVRVILFGNAIKKNPKLESLFKIEIREIVTSLENNEMLNMHFIKIKERILMQLVFYINLIRKMKQI